MNVLDGEVDWYKSSASATGNCVEVAQPAGGNILVRDSKHPEGPHLEFTETEWMCFLKGVRQGEFDTRN